MHRIVPIVFKIVIGSMLLMAALDTTLVLYELISIHSKVSAFSTVVQMEVASNNCLPSSMADSFQEQLEDILEPYKMYSDNDGSLTCNLKSDVAVSANKSIASLGDPEESHGRFKSLAEINAKDYGEFQTLVIQIKLFPEYVVFGYENGHSGIDFAKDRRAITLNYIYKVPCLRYLK